MGGELPTVTDANVVLGFLPSGEVRLGGEMEIRYDLAEKAVKTIADALGLSVKEAAAGIVDIVNENMYGALRLVSVEKGYDPREFALMGFGGAGPLHANALGKLMNSWPVIIPPGPGVLCAYGDATTRARDEASRTFIRRFPQTTSKEIIGIYKRLAAQATKTLTAEGVAKSDQTISYEADIRYHGQGLLITIDFNLDDLVKNGLDGIGDEFDKKHTQLFTFALPEDKELVNLRAVAQGKPPKVQGTKLARGSVDPSAARIAEHNMYVEGKDRKGALYERAKLKAGNIIKGPAVVLEMDATTVVLPGHVAKVDTFGNLLITPDA